MKFIIALLLIVHFSELHCQPFIPIQKLEAFDPAENDWFGFSLAADENTLAIGAPHKILIRKSDTLKSVGAVYVYHKKNHAWSLSEKLIPPYPLPFDFFGEGLAIDNNTLYITAKGDNNDTTNKAHSVEDGAVYVYQKNPGGNWNLSGKMTAPVRNQHDNYGQSLEVWGDYVCIGSSGSRQKNVEKSRGCIYVYHKQESGLPKLIQVLLPNSHTFHSSIGTSLSMKDSLLCVYSAEGNWNKTGESHYGAGAVYIYKLNTHGKWDLNQKLVSRDSNSLRDFGNSIKISDDHLFIGVKPNPPIYLNEMHKTKGIVEVYKKNHENEYEYRQTLYPNDTNLYSWFGNSISCSGQFTAIGAMGEDSLLNSAGHYVGAVYLFGYSEENGYRNIRKYNSPQKKAWDKFGFSVKLNADELIIGSRFEKRIKPNGGLIEDAGAVYIFPIE